MKSFVVKEVRVYVQQGDIDNATCGAWNCPLALAIFRATGLKTLVSGQEVWFTTKGKINNRISYLPAEACEFIKEFDKVVKGDRTALKPFSFLLDVPKDA